LLVGLLMLAGCGGGDEIVADGLHLVLTSTAD
jgi:hypothetical protein